MYFRAGVNCTVSILAPAQGASATTIQSRVRVMFQFSPPHRGHQAVLSDLSVLHLGFNSRPRTGGIPLDAPVLAFDVPSFNSRPRTGGIRSHKYEWNQQNVSILAPAQGASVGTGKQSTRKMFQFSPPHRGHPTGGNGNSKARGVSILAPAQGASFTYPYYGLWCTVSILAPAQGASSGEPNWRYI